jgi:hypothetical protein
MITERNREALEAFRGQTAVTVTSPLTESAPVRGLQRKSIQGLGHLSQYINIFSLPPKSGRIGDMALLRSRCDISASRE